MLETKSLCLWVFFLHVYVCTMYVLRAQGGQKRVLDPWDWNYTVVSYPVGSGNLGSRSFGRTASGLNC